MTQPRHHPAAPSLDEVESGEVPFHLNSNPYCTRRQAADYLCWKDTDSLDPHLIDQEQFQSGHIRVKRVQVGALTRVFCLRADVLELLPPPSSTP